MNITLNDAINNVVQRNDQVKDNNEKIDALIEKRDKEIKDIKKSYKTQIDDVKKVRNAIVKEQSQVISQAMRSNPKWYEDVEFYDIVSNYTLENRGRKNSLVNKELKNMFDHPLLETYDNRYGASWMSYVPKAMLHETTTHDEIHDLVKYIEPFFNARFTYINSPYCKNKHFYSKPEIYVNIYNQQEVLQWGSIITMKAPGNYRLDIPSAGATLSLFDAFVKFHDSCTRMKRKAQ